MKILKKRGPRPNQPLREPRRGTLHRKLWLMEPGEYIFIDKPDRQITAAISASRFLNNVDFTTSRLVAIPGMGNGAKSAFDLVKVTRKS